MPLGDDPTRLSATTVAKRAAALCEIAEQQNPGHPLYIIGTKVPPPD